MFKTISRKWNRSYPTFAFKHFVYIFRTLPFQFSVGDTNLQATVLDFHLEIQFLKIDSNVYSLHL